MIGARKWLGALFNIAVGLLHIDDHVFDPFHHVAIACSRCFAIRSDPHTTRWGMGSRTTAMMCMRLHMDVVQDKKATNNTLIRRYTGQPDMYVV